MDIEKLRFVSAAEAAAMSSGGGGGGGDYGGGGNPHLRSGGQRLGGLAEDPYERQHDEADPYGESPPMDDPAGASFGGRDGGYPGASGGGAPCSCASLLLLPISC